MLDKRKSTQTRSPHSPVDLPIWLWVLVYSLAAFVIIYYWDTP